MHAECFNLSSIDHDFFGCTSLFAPAYRNERISLGLHLATQASQFTHHIVDWYSDNRHYGYRHEQLHSDYLALHVHYDHQPDHDNYYQYDNGAYYN